MNRRRVEALRDEAFKRDHLPQYNLISELIDAILEEDPDAEPAGQDSPPRYCKICRAADWCHAPGGSRYGSCRGVYEDTPAPQVTVETQLYTGSARLRIEMSPYEVAQLMSFLNQDPIVARTLRVRNLEFLHNAGNGLEITVTPRG